MKKHDKPKSEKLRWCKRTDILCVDCTDELCWHHGDICSDCPKWICDNTKQYNCEHCKFIKDYVKKFREGKIK